MKTFAKLMIAAIPAMMVAAPSFALTAASDNVDIVLNGEVPSICFLTPDSAVNKNVDMANGLTSQNLVTINYSCNSPYTVTLKSANGGMKHHSNTFTVKYDVKVLGIPTGGSYHAANLAGAGQSIDSSNNWTNIGLNGDIKNLRLDLEFNGLNDYLVAGNYTDTLTVGIKADL